MACSDEIRQRQRKYVPGSTQKPGEHPYKKVCMQLFGMTGHGKSSLINSCICVVHDNEYENISNAGKSNDPITMERAFQRLLPTVSISDNRGIVKLNPEERHEMTAQLCALHINGEVKWERDFEYTINMFLEKINKPQEQFILPVFVYSANLRLTEDKMKEILPFFKDAEAVTGVFPIIVITNWENEKIQAYEASGKLQRNGAGHVILLENYTTTDSARTAKKDATILKFVDTCLQEADRGIAMKRDTNPQNEFVKRAAELMREMTKSIIESKDRQIKDLEEQLEEKKAKATMAMYEKVTLENRLQEFKTRGY